MNHCNKAKYVVISVDWLAWRVGSLVNTTLETSIKIRNAVVDENATKQQYDWLKDEK